MQKEIVFSHIGKLSNFKCFLRLVGRKTNAYAIDIDSTLIAYQKSKNEVTIYTEANNGIPKNSRDYNKVSRFDVGNIILHVSFSKKVQLPM